MNILQRVIKLEEKEDTTTEIIQELKDRIEKLEIIIETMGYYISKRG